MWCGDCPTCRERTAARLAATSSLHDRVKATPITAERLERHAKRFGPEGVAETAAELGVDVTVERPKRKAARRGPTLKERVAGHIEAGHSVELIAELENLSPSRARRLVAEVQA